jgi:NAD(P)-dependent dehydrogenase (short-subunit alcohol dehydrogenase family)
VMAPSAGATCKAQNGSVPRTSTAPRNGASGSSVLDKARIGAGGALGGEASGGALCGLHAESHIALAKAAQTRILSPKRREPCERMPGMQLIDKVCVITGGCSGIGLAGVERFLEGGARVVCADIQDDKGAALLARFGPERFAYVHCDVLEEAHILAAMDGAVARFGRLDVVWNNAGACTAPAGIAEIAIADFEREMRLLLTSVVAGIKYAIPHFTRQGGGAIINTASMAALQIGHAPFAYATAKGAVKWMTSQLAVDLARQNIRVNCICPGYIPTSIVGRGLGLPVTQADQLAAQIADGLRDAQPLPGPIPARAIADAAMFLASDAAAYVTGHALVVDGANSLAPPHAWDPTVTAPLLKALGPDFSLPG